MQPITKQVPMGTYYSGACHGGMGVALRHYFHDYIALHITNIFEL